MKSKFLPCLIMLLAGFICSIISIRQSVDLMTFTTRLLLVLVIFYIIGAIIRVVLDKAFAAMADKDVKDDDTAEDTSDNETDSAEDNTQ